jgi:hypothetical protein
MHRRHCSRAVQRCSQLSSVIKILQTPGMRSSRVGSDAAHGGGVTRAKRCMGTLFAVMAGTVCAYSAWYFNTDAPPQLLSNGGGIKGDTVLVAHMRDRSTSPVNTADATNDTSAQEPTRPTAIATSRCDPPVLLSALFSSRGWLDSRQLTAKQCRVLQSVCMSMWWVVA